MAQPPADEQQTALALAAAMAAYQAQSVALRARVERIVRSAWASLGSYRNPDVARFIAQVLPIVAGGQQAMAALTAANLAQQDHVALRVPFRPAAVDVRAVTGAAARNGADPREVYGRAFHLVWRQLAELPHASGMVDQAIGAGQDRAVELALDDLQLTKKRTALQIIGPDDRVVGYRRVLEGAHSCGLCIVASTQRYHREEMLPIHGGCDCSVAKIWGTTDPGRLISAVANVNGRLTPVAELADVHDRIEQRFGRSSSAARAIPGARDAHGRILAYRDVLITHEHGELGPVLGVKGQPFTGPDDLAA